MVAAQLIFKDQTWIRQGLYGNAQYGENREMQFSRGASGSIRFFDDPTTGEFNPGTSSGTFWCLRCHQGPKLLEFDEKRDRYHDPSCSEEGYEFLLGWQRKLAL